MNTHKLLLPGLLAITIGLAACGAADPTKAGSPASSAPCSGVAADGTKVASSQTSQRPEDVRAYWTPERIAAAKPAMPMVTAQPGSGAAVTNPCPEASPTSVPPRKAPRR
jgi:hypothetical protein